MTHNLSLYIKKISIFTLFLILFSCTSSPSNKLASTDSENSSEESIIFPDGFIHSLGPKLVIGNNTDPIYLRGINMGTHVFNKQLDNAFFSQSDYKRVSDLGMNAIRLHLNYHHFFTESGFDENGFTWLDQQLSWAKSQNIYIILALMVWPGGPQLHDAQLRNDQFWTSVADQDQLIQLWTEIAKRYNAHKHIAGYDIINEPLPPTIAQGKYMLNQIIDAIRKFDTNHLLIIQALSATSNDNSNAYDPAQMYVLMDDSNVMYDFHHYAPIAFTHQNFEAHGYSDAGPYPDTTTIIYPRDMRSKSSFDTTIQLTALDNEWSYHESSSITIKDSDIIAVRPAFLCNSLSGNIYLDDYTISEITADTHTTIVRMQSSSSNDASWQFWNETMQRTETIMPHQQYGHGNDDNRSFMLHSSSSNHIWGAPINITSGHSYQISAWIKGENITDAQECQLQLLAEYSPSATKALPLSDAYVDHMISHWSEFGRTNNVPIHIGEFGILSDSTMNANKGGLEWIKDSMTSMQGYNLHYSFYGYAHLNFFADNSPNTQLINLLKLMHADQ